jgi:hypothetical protein
MVETVEKRGNSTNIQNTITVSKAEGRSTSKL